MRLILALVLLAAPAWSDTADVVNNHITPRYAALVQTTEALAKAAQESCDVEALKPPFHAAYDAWISVSHIQFGPIEEIDLILPMAFWPDTRDKTGKALARLTAASDPIVDTVAGFDTVSVAAQGFPALERMLYDPQTDADYACRLTRAITSGLAEKSQRIFKAWPAFAAGMLDVGQSDRFQSNDEVLRTIYTALNSSLTILHDQRLGRPLGTFDRPRPLRAEARRSARSLRHVALVLDTLEDLATRMSDTTLPATTVAFAKARTRVETLHDPDFSSVTNPQSRIRAEVLQQRVRDIQMAVVAEIGIPLRLPIGFSSLDGD